MNLFRPPDPDSGILQDELIRIINKIFPLPARFARGLPADVQELSSLFTSRREERGHSYLGKPNLLSAYLRYFLPWNVYRLCRLLPSLPLDLKEGSIVFDIGSGPLTFALALWISRPEFRNISLQFYCLDRTHTVLDAGKKIFAAFTALHPDLAGKWEIKTIRGELIRNNFRISSGGRQVFVHPDKILRGKKADLVTAINVFNEIYWDLSPIDEEQGKLADNSASVLAACAGEGAALVIEPGIPRSGEFISELRSSFIDRGFGIVSPCLHKETCPFAGGMSAKTKWCHFAFETDDAPKKLQKLSDSAGIPKERAVLSFLLAAKKFTVPAMPGGPVLPARIVSDPFPVGPQYARQVQFGRQIPFARYACSARGAVLVTGSEEKIKSISSGDCIDAAIHGERDRKSGALTGEIN